jgi:hypothetical protein
MAHRKDAGPFHVSTSSLRGERIVDFSLPKAVNRKPSTIGGAYRVERVLYSDYRPQPSTEERRYSAASG